MWFILFYLFIKSPWYFTMLLIWVFGLMLINQANRAISTG